MNILEELSQSTIQLLLTEPFYAHMIGGLNKQIVYKGHEVETMAIGSGPNQTLALYVNADFWQNELQNPKYRVGVLKHEMLHIVFRHMFVREPGLDSHLLNIAFDLVVNQYIAREYLPDDSIFLDSFPELHLEAGQTWFYYYKKMESLQKGPAGTESAHGQSNEKLSQIGQNSSGLERHQPWQEIQHRSELENSVTEDHVESLMRTAMQRTASHQWGHLPGQIREILTELTQNNGAQLNWKSALRLFVGSTGKTRMRNTIQRPSRRYGTTPGLKIKHLQRIYVALDSSGSVSHEDLTLFFKEIFHIWRAGVQVEILECDVRIENRFPYKGKMPTFIHGRGGTNFDPPLKVANDERPDGMIYFTDGFAAVPQTKPLVPLLWVITRQGLDSSSPDFHRLPGRKVQIG
jgi:predicted metal-dependent peptidase